MCLFSCDEDNKTSFSSRNNNSWFTEKELANVGLNNLLAPINCKGTLTIDNHWYNNGLALYQECENATTYLNYFVEKYDNLFRYTITYASSKDTLYYYIVNDKN